MPTVRSGTWYTMHTPLGDSSAHGRTRTIDTVVVVDFDPIVVTDPELLGVYLAHPDRLATS